MTHPPLLRPGLRRVKRPGSSSIEKVVLYRKKCIDEVCIEKNVETKVLYRKGVYRTILYRKVASEKGVVLKNQYINNVYRKVVSEKYVRHRLYRKNKFVIVNNYVQKHKIKQHIDVNK